MKRNTIIKFLSISLFFSMSALVMAADTSDSNPADNKVTNEQSVQAMSSGEVKKVDKEQGKLTIKHGELKNLGMPPMTMVFHVQEASLLDKLVVGQKIKFIAENVNGALTVVKVE